MVPLQRVCTILEFISSLDFKVEFMSLIGILQTHRPISTVKVKVKGYGDVCVRFDFCPIKLNQEPETIDTFMRIFEQLKQEYLDTNITHQHTLRKATISIIQE